MSEFLTAPDFPYCKGCGHHLIARNTVRALEALGRDPLDVILVTDIGCHGIVDRNFATHTIHGLHGRSVALGSGIAMGVSDEKEVVVFIGDGGATIGLQHLLEAARLNVGMTVVVHNNMLYGMTGGQPSGLTPCGFRTDITKEGSPYPHHDLCQLVHDAGAPYARRVLGLGDFSGELGEALEVEGFALVEVLELCTSYALKMNPDLRLRELAKERDYEPGLWRSAKRLGEGDCVDPIAHRPPLRLDWLGEGDCVDPIAPSPPSLLDGEKVKETEVRFSSSLEDSPMPPVGSTPSRAVVLGGSAGEGAQRAAELFAQAAMASGLHATKKGSYPVTVGVGFSTAEVIVSHDPILYHGISQPDAVIVTSADGLAHNRDRIRGMTGGTVWIDEGLDAPETGAEVRLRDFRERAGAQNAAIYGLLTFVEESGVIPREAMVEAVRTSSVGALVPDDLLRGRRPQGAGERHDH
jgi:pyruvate/2-oxoacid:ferredoxin oxidoreductase beta subunit/Pyruvate/2-oxoacid:ferredoxin oxidoreductase gamma subunit